MGSSTCRRYGRAEIAHSRRMVWYAAWLNV